MNFPPVQFRTLGLSAPALEVEDLRWMVAKSGSLGHRADLLIHATPRARETRDVPVVILLHGVYGSAWSWCFQGGAHRVNARLQAANAIPPVVLAMPSDGLWGDGSGYVRHDRSDFERWIVDEVPAALSSAIPAVGAGSPVCLAGLSMGGFGALRLGGKYPERFAAISAHSAITEFAQMALFVEEPLEQYRAPSEDRSVLATLRENRGRLPPLRFDCGTEDPLISANRTLHAALESEGIAHTYEEFPGAHAWEYWQTHLEDTLRFFGDVLKRRRT